MSVITCIDCNRSIDTDFEDTEGEICSDCLDKLPNGWYIQYNPKPIPLRKFDYDFWNDDHDGVNGLCGTASSIQDALEQINEIETNR